MKKQMMLALAPTVFMGLIMAVPAFADTSMMTSSSMMTTPSSNLMMGSEGADVSSLQTFLVAKGFLTIPTGVSMGYFGSLTKSALVRYQASAGLPATGYFGTLTRAKLMAAMQMSMGSTSNMSTGMTTGSSMGMTSGMTSTGATVSTSGSSMNTSSSAGVMVGGALMTPNRNIVQNAVNASNVTTLVAAVQAAGLVPTLESAGPFTVFAPDNNAFAKLPAGTVTTLLMPANLAELKDILTYHVVSGTYTSATLYNGEVLTSVEGKPITIGKSASGQLTINGTAMVETPDIISSNGVTFVIDTVLTPPSK
jgi:uncharacterized surface protein with fasciclin (FAS1) repeats